MQLEKRLAGPPPSALTFPYPTPPSAQQAIEVVPGILWCRLALPFQLNHVNIYLIDDGDGWTLVDTGLGDEATQQAWEGLLREPFLQRPITRIIATHFHPDHVGCAGFLLKRFDVPLYMSGTEYLQSLNIHLDPGALEAAHYRRFYTEHGLDAVTTEAVVTGGHRYLRLISGLPPTYYRLVAGDTLAIGGRTFEVLTGGGHSPEQIMLLSRHDRIFLAADQVLAKITPNVSVHAVDPEGDPLGLYLRSLKALANDVPGDALVLPGHNLPFRGLRRRIAELEEHHDARCEQIVDACRATPKSAAELVPVIFHRPLDPHQMGFAFSEVLAHVNLMLRQGEIREVRDGAAIRRVIAA